MKTSFVLLSIPALMAASIVAVVACSPQSGSIPVQISEQSPLRQAIETCAKNVREGKDTKVQGRTAKICMVPDVGADKDDSDIDPMDPAAGQEVDLLAPNDEEKAGEILGEKSIEEGSDEGEKTGYRTMERPVRYTISKKDGRLKASLLVKLHLPKELMASDKDVARVRETQQRLRKILYNQCIVGIRDVWRRSGVDLGLEFRLRKASEGTVFDQHLRLVSEDALGEHPRLRAVSWPDRGELRPFGDASLNAGCLKLKSASEKEACLDEALVRANADFCLNLALMVGHWTGLEGDALAANACPNDKGNEPTTKKPNESHPSYMKSGSSETEKQAFWQSAKLSAGDLKTLFQSVCPSVLNR